jgi:hypothetical protein
MLTLFVHNFTVETVDFYRLLSQTIILLLQQLPDYATLQVIVTANITIYRNFCPSRYCDVSLCKSMLANALISRRYYDSCPSQSLPHAAARPNLARGRREGKGF